MVDGLPHEGGLTSYVPKSVDVDLFPGSRNGSAETLKSQVVRTWISRSVCIACRLWNEGFSDPSRKEIPLLFFFLLTEKSCYREVLVTTQRRGGGVRGSRWRLVAISVASRGNLACRRSSQGREQGFFLRGASGFRKTATLKKIAFRLKNLCKKSTR